MLKAEEWRLNETKSPHMPSSDNSPTDNSPTDNSPTVTNASSGSELAKKPMRGIARTMQQARCPCQSSTENTVIYIVMAAFLLVYSYGLYSYGSTENRAATWDPCLPTSWFSCRRLHSVFVGLLSDFVCSGDKKEKDRVAGEEGDGGGNGGWQLSCSERDGCACCG